MAREIIPFRQNIPVFPEIGKFFSFFRVTKVRSVYEEMTRMFCIFAASKKSFQHHSVRRNILPKLDRNMKKNFTLHSL
jgi:hypothetical protein